MARSLRTRQTHTLALIVSDISNPSLAAMASAAEESARARGYTLVLYNTHDDVERERSYIQSAIQHWMAGVLIVPAEYNPDCLLALQAAGIPFVTVDRRLDGCGGPSVILDHYGAGRVAAEHLIALGHRALGHITGPLRLRLYERLAGFCDLAQATACQATLAARLKATGIANQMQAMRRMLACRLNGRRSVFSAHDRMGIGAMRAMREAGLRVPEDISLVGLDDIEVAAYQSPPLTTVRQPFANMAVRAVELLIALLEDRAPEKPDIVIPPQLIVRQSTARCGP